MTIGKARGHNRAWSRAKKLKKPCMIRPPYLPCTVPGSVGFDSHGCDRNPIVDTPFWQAELVESFWWLLNLNPNPKPNLKLHPFFNAISRHLLSKVIQLSPCFRISLLRSWKVSFGSILCWYLVRKLSRIFSKLLRSSLERVRNQSMGSPSSK